MIKLKPQQVKFTLACENEECDVAGSFDDPETVAWIRNQLARGNEYAWFSANVTASLETNHDEIGNDKTVDVISATDYLGALSYESKETFLASEEFAEMKRNALDLLNQKVNTILGELLQLDQESAF